MNIVNCFFAICLVVTSTSFAQTHKTIGKSCGSCGKSVAISSKIGDVCPYCGVRWGYENTTTTSSTSTNNSSNSNYLNLYNPSSNKKVATHNKTHYTDSRPVKINPFSANSKQMIEEWLIERLVKYSQKRVYNSYDPLTRIGISSTYSDFEFKFSGEFLIIKYNYNYENNILVYVPIYDILNTYGDPSTYDFSIATNGNTMYEVNQKYDSKTVTNYVCIGYRNDAEIELTDRMDLAFDQLKRFYKKPVSTNLPEFIPASEVNKPSLLETQNWIVTKLNSYKQNLSVGGGSSSNVGSNFSFSFSGFDLVINYKETSSLRAYGNDNIWTQNYSVIVPICDCSPYVPTNDRGIGSVTFGGGNFGFISRSKTIIKNKQGRATEYVSSFDISIDFEREIDLLDRMNKAINTLKTYCSTDTKSKEAF